MLNLPAYDIEVVKPHNFQEIIVTNGYSYKSGIWIVLPNGDEGFLMDPDDELEIIYWIPTPEVKEQP